MEKDFVASEVIGQGLAYTIMGICIVFLILIIIMFVIKAMALISAAPEAKKPQQAGTVAPASAVQAPQPQAEAQEDELELIAVITAAVAASLGTSPADIYVKSYKRIDGGAWNRAGRREVLQNKF